MTVEDGRSVGELLLDADVMTRQLLFDVRGEDAPAMLRTWGEVVQAAAELWTALPPPVEDPGGPDRPRPPDAMTRLQSVATAMHRTQIRHGWPGDGPGDERLLRVAATLARAGELVERRGGHIRAVSAGDRADIAAARMRIMHTLYVGAHGVGLALREHVRDLQGEPMRTASARQTRGIYRGAEAATRLGAFEQLAGAQIGRRFAAGIRGEVRPEPVGTARLGQALVGWDIQAHRSLAAEPTGANLLLVTRMQASIATTALVLLHAGAQSGHLDPATFARLGPAIEASQQAWTQAARRWTDLVPPAGRADPALVAAASELRAATREVTQDKAGWAQPEEIGRRVNLGTTAATLHQGLAAAVDIGYIARDVAAHERTLTGPARAVSARAAADTHHQAEPGDRPSPTAVWVAPVEAHANRLIPLPPPVRQGLVAANDHAANAADQALSAAACLDRPRPSEPTTGAAPRGLGRQSRDRAPAPLPTPPNESVRR